MKEYWLDEPRNAGNAAKQGSSDGQTTMNSAALAMHPTVDPTKMLDHLPVSTRQTVIFALCFLLNMVDGMDVVIMSYAASGVMSEFDIGEVQMGGVFSAGLVGMAIGGLVLGSYADKLGRRALIIGGLVLIASGVILGGLAGSATELLITRVIAGFGIGGLLASVTALTAEYAPARIRNNVVMLIASGYPLGATLTGLVSSWAVPEYGWRATMIGAGVLTAAIVVPCLLFLSESLPFLARKGGVNAVSAINRHMQIMRHPPIGAIDPDFLDRHGTFKVSDLLNATYRLTSLRLWGGLICTFMVMYYLLSWIPRIAIEAGLAPSNAIVAAAMFSGGGFLGVFMVGVLANRIGYVRAIVSYCIIAAATMLIYSSYRGELAIVLLIAVVMGFTVQGAVGAFYGAAARAYPVEMKSSGIGWTIGVGRIGAIIGPYFGGVLLAMKLPLLLSFLIFGMVMLIGAAIIWPLRKVIETGESSVPGR